MSKISFDVEWPASFGELSLARSCLSVSSDRRERRARDGQFARVYAQKWLYAASRKRGRTTTIAAYRIVDGVRAKKYATKPSERGCERLRARARAQSTDCNARRLAFSRCLAAAAAATSTWRRRLRERAVASACQRGRARAFRTAAAATQPSARFQTRVTAAQRRVFNSSKIVVNNKKTEPKRKCIRVHVATIGVEFQVGGRSKRARANDAVLTRRTFARAWLRRGPTVGEKHVVNIQQNTPALTLIAAICHRARARKE